MVLQRDTEEYKTGLLCHSVAAIMRGTLDHLEYKDRGLTLLWINGESESLEPISQSDAV